MLRKTILAGMAAFAIGGSLVACTTSGGVPAAAPTATINPQASPQASQTAEGTDLMARGYVDSGDGKLRVSGKSPLTVTITEVRTPPPAPEGWELVTPVFDITACDRQKRAVSRLPDPVDLRFDLGGNPAATIMYFDGQVWQMMPSELDSQGRLTAQVDHFTPYAAGKPTNMKKANPANSGGARTPAGGPSAQPTVMVAPGLVGDGGERAERGDQGAEGQGDQAHLGHGLQRPRLRGHAARAPGCARRRGQRLLWPLQRRQRGGTVEAGGSGGKSGALTLLVEPKTTMPTSAAAAQDQLAKLFPGVAVSLTQVEASSTGYVFSGASGNTAYSLGYVSYQGVPLAYALSGSGSYQSLVPKG